MYVLYIVIQVHIFHKNYIHVLYICIYTIYKFYINKNTSCTVVYINHIFLTKEKFLKMYKYYKNIEI